MTHYDVFNGDADGLCALRQLRLADPRDSRLVTGPKRDIALLERVQAGRGDSVTVLDLSLAANRDPLLRLLAQGVAVEWFDHHDAGEIPANPLLAAHVDPSPDICTALLVDRHLQGCARAWGVTGAFGDNLPEPARALARVIGLREADVERLRVLGEALAYNAYGDSLADLIVDPAELYATLARYRDPLAFAACEPVLARIGASRASDLALALRVPPCMESPGAAAYLLPDARWSRRVRGALANERANRDPSRAHAVLSPNGRGGYTVSVRSPANAPSRADRLCVSFPSGGGRARAAGINDLPAARLEVFMAELRRAYGAACAPPGTATRTHR